MACSQPGHNQTDLFSKLPAEVLITIISFLPPHEAARATVLCRAFHRLWEVSPFVRIIHEINNPVNGFVAEGDRAVLRRSPSHPLLSLHLELRDLKDLVPASYIPSLLAKAGPIGLCHLTIRGIMHYAPILPSIFSLRNLKSLGLPSLGRHIVFPSGSTLTCLKSLSLGIHGIDSPRLNQLLSQLGSLEELYLKFRETDRLTLCSQTIKKLKLKSIGNHPKPELNTLGLFLPALESLHLRNWKLHDSQFGIYGELPSMRRALISLHGVDEQNASAVRSMLRFISHVEDLSLLVREYYLWVIGFIPF